MQKIVHRQPVNILKGALHHVLGHVETDEIMVLLRVVAVLCDFQHIKAEFRAQMSFTVVFVRNPGSIFFAEFRIDDRNREIYRLMTVYISGIVAERAKRERKFIASARFANHPRYEIARSYVVDIIGELLIAQRIVTHVLNY